jgi:presenilin-like A22 family membrane protease
MRGLRSVGLLVIFVGAQLVGLALAAPFRSAGLASTSTSTANNPFAPLYLLVLIVLAPLAILWLARRSGGLAAIRLLILVGMSAALYLTLGATFAIFVPAISLTGPFLPATMAVTGPLYLSTTLAAIASVAILLALLMDPQWYVVDGAGFLAAGALIALLGISFGPLPVIILLALLAVYDYIAVYRTKHMLSLADVVVDLRLPILLVMPSGPDYDYPNAPPLKARTAEPGAGVERDAMFMGLGDVIIPGILVVSSFIWLPAKVLFPGFGANLAVAFGTLLGALAGYAGLTYLVNKGNPQAGLPFLDGGAIAGYLVAYLLFFHNLTFGLSYSLSL